MTRYAAEERRALADLLHQTGPDAPTLCTGWTTRDLAAHILVRERRPDAAAGIVLRGLRDHGEQVRRAVAARPYAELVEELRRPPWWSPLSNPFTDELSNGTEMLVHHEDVRRAGPGWEPRELTSAHQEQVFRRVSRMARFYLGRLGIPLTLVAPGYGEVGVGTPPPVARLAGTPVDLLLFLTGRQRAARVDVDAEPPVADRLRTARLGV